MPRTKFDRLRLYLAGPEVFRPDAAEEGERLRAICAAAGVDGIYPLDGEGGNIRRNCLTMIAQSDGLVANISPFRGHHMDPGTAFEIGYAEALGKPVFLWSTDPRSLQDRITASADGRDTNGMRVEAFGKPENLMIVPDGATVWLTPEDAIAAAAASLEHHHKNMSLQRSTRRSVLIAAGVSLAAALAAGAVLDRFIGW
jgi:nucleoside 2-deoxyribosyltransferase